MFEQALLQKAEALLEACRQRGVKLATAESCTGGLIAALLTDVAGSSDVFDRGFATYSNNAKTQMLGVSPMLIAEHGAVSEPVAVAMAQGALHHSAAQLTVSVTGIAGPSGGSAEKPVGLVHFGCALAGAAEVLHSQKIFSGNRQQVRMAAVEHAVALLHRRL